jgi:taurine dioxygenase
MHMNQETRSAPAVVRAAATRDSIKVERLTCTIGAELSGISLGDASRDDALFAEIRSLLLAHKVLFLSGQDITRAEHVAFARRFGELEDHPVMASDRDHPGLVLIDKGPDTRAEQYENAWHCDTTWRECPQMGAVLRCTEAPDVGGDMLWADMTLAPEYQVRWRLRRNSVAIWDNRCTQHYAVQDFWPAVRKLERAGIVGDRPY